MKLFFADNLRHLQRKSLIGQIVVVILGVHILFMSSFISFSLPTATYRNMQTYAFKCARKIDRYLPEKAKSYLEQHLSFLNQTDENETIRYTSYVALVPASVLMGYVLGIPLAIFAALIYFGFGLIGPNLGIYPFAEGGGLHYYTQPGFGYLIGIVIAVGFVGWITSGNRSSVRQLLAVLGGIFLVHAIGILYLLGTSLLILLLQSEASYLNWQPWLMGQIRNLSWYQIPYDLIFSFALIGLAFPARWLTEILTAPDIGSRAKTKWKSVPKEVV